MATIPSFSDVLSSPGTLESPLARALSTLFEPSAVLLEKLVPELASQSLSITTYSSLIDLAVTTISSWDTHTRAAFIAAHPRIGEVGNLSHLSRQEQAAKATPPDVLARLAQLNAMYERRYPGLRYITFVNGRSRAEIRDEMEGVLGGAGDREGGGEGVGGEVMPVEVGGSEWMKELDRAVVDVGRIAKSRLAALGAV
ncbi:Oxo-4-hydroxy-4-carboxy-5-ureidoimidazoline decarboxylase [Gautieria morchelliformis]|nr:Oxo-4-hydroxy-4-carboxy-5-ureidoimidazoline decarboxylase [Gautieria morchelliformis]